MKVKSSLLFYIGNGVVKGAIVSLEKDKLPCIVTARVRNLPYYEERDREHLENRIIHEFTELVKEMKAKDVTNPLAHKLKIENALVILSSPWYVSETSLIKMKEQKPFLVTDKLLQSSRENVVKAYRDAHQLDIAVLEQEILQVSLNGYKTAEPLKKKADSLEMSIFTSFARSSSVDKLKDAIESNFHIANVRIHSQSLMSFSVIGSVWKDLQQYIIADVTSELTELIAVRNGALAEDATFPKGKGYLLKLLGDRLGIAPEVAVSFLKSKESGMVEEGISKKIDDALAVGKTDWLKDFSQALSTLSSGSSLPKTFFLFAPRDTVKIFSDFILSEEYQQFSFAEGNFEVRTLSTVDFKAACTYEKEVIPDLSLTMSAIFNNLI